MTDTVAVTVIVIVTVILTVTVIVPASNSHIYIYIYKYKLSIWASELSELSGTDRPSGTTSRPILLLQMTFRPVLLLRDDISIYAAALG